MDKLINDIDSLYRELIHYISKNNFDESLMILEDMKDIVKDKQLLEEEEQ